MSTSGCPNSARRARRASSSRSFTRMFVLCMKAFVEVPRSPVSLYLPGLKKKPSLVDILGILLRFLKIKLIV